MGVSLREYLKYGAKGPTTRGTRADRTRLDTKRSPDVWSKYYANRRQRAKWKAISRSLQKKKKKEQVSSDAKAYDMG